MTKGDAMKSTGAVALQPGRFITKKFLQVALLTVSLMMVLPGLCDGNTIKVLDWEGNVGWEPSIAINADGLPVISYATRAPIPYPNGLLYLKVAFCADAQCSSWTLRTVDSSDHAIEMTSIAIGDDNLPVISYRDRNTGLKVAKCDSLDSNAVCLSWTITQIPSSGQGLYSSIAVDKNNLPVISYQTFSSLRVLKCGNAACSSGNVDTLLHVYNNPGYTAIAIGNDDNPIIAHIWYGLDVVKCGNPSCTSGNSFTDVESNMSGLEVDIAIGNDGNPVISYYDEQLDDPENGGDLKVAKCNDPACSSATITPVDSVGTVGRHTSIAIGSDNNPVISYWAWTGADLRVAKCNNADCSSATKNTVDSVGEVGWFTSIAIGTNGFPVISYFDQTNGDLKLALCSDEACTSTIDTIAPVVTAFSIPSTSSSLTVSITTFTVTDAVGVTGYLLTESSAKPAADAAGWSGTKPASYTFGSEGSKTLFAWAKDAAGNVSDGIMSASVMITLPPPAAFIVTEPAAGASVPTGSACTVTWTAKTGAASYKVKLSIDGGATWPITLGTGINSTTTTWTVPTNIPKNITNAMIKVMAYDGNNMKLGAAKSGIFSIDVLTITAPASGEIVPQNAPYTIVWTAHGTASNPDEVVVQYKLSSASQWKTAKGTRGASSFIWNVPAVAKPKSNVKVKVIFKSGGATVAKATSGTFKVQ